MTYAIISDLDNNGEMAGVKTEAEILPKYPQTYFSLGRLDMARFPQHPSTAFSNFLVVHGKAYVILK